MINKNDLKNAKEAFKYDSNVIFSVFIIMAVSFEMKYKVNINVKEIEKIVILLKSSLLNTLGDIFLVYFQAINLNKAKKILDGYNFTEEQKNFIDKWVRQEINFVNPNL